MRRVWAAVLAVWATIAIVAVLAWTHAPAQPLAQGTAATVVVRGPGGTTHLARVVLLPSGTAAHATTSSSPTAGGATTQLVVQNGTIVASSTTAQPHATTHTS